MFGFLKIEFWLNVVCPTNIFIIYLKIKTMKKVIIFTLLVLFGLTQNPNTYPRPSVNQQPQRTNPDPYWQQSTGVPSSNMPDGRQRQNGMPEQPQLKTEDGKMKDHRKEDNKERTRAPNGNPLPNVPGQNQQIPDEMVMFFIIFYGTIFLMVLCVCGCMSYFCLKKRQERNKIKTRMQELQAMFAQSQNMNVFQMNAQPHFPKTIHI